MPDFAKDALPSSSAGYFGDDASEEEALWQEWFQSALRRTFSEGEHGGPLKRKYFRYGVCWFLRALEHNIKELTGQGFEQFTIGPLGNSLHRLAGNDPMPPVLSVLSDQASVCFNAGYALRRKFNLAQEQPMETSHRCQNDLLGALKAGGPFWEAISLFYVVSKVNYGPYEGAAFLQILNEVSAKFKQQVARDSVAFTAFLSGMAYDKNLPADIVGDPEFQQECWVGLEDDRVCKLKGPALQPARWGAILDCLEYWLPIWHQRLCLCVFWCLLEGLPLLKTKDAPTMPELRPPVSHTGPRGGRLPLRESAQRGIVKRVKDKGKNGLHSATLVLCMSDVNRVLRMVQKACKHHRQELGRHRRDVRSIRDSNLFFAEMAAGKKSVAPIVYTFEELTNKDTLHYCGFVFDFERYPTLIFMQDSEHAVDEGDWFQEYFFAHYSFQLPAIEIHPLACARARLAGRCVVRGRRRLRCRAGPHGRTLGRFRECQTADNCCCAETGVQFVFQ